MKHLKLIAIVGPTASGKSALAVNLAKKFGGVVISADSRQIYRGMDVGTTKITKPEMQSVPHYMLGIVDPDDVFSVSLYQKSVLNLLQSIKRKNKKLRKPIIPFLVGGTGLYVSAITDGLQFSNVPPNPKLRAQLEKKSLKDLVRQLTKLNPDTAIDTKNKRRVIRAIEILKSGGHKPTKTKPDFPVLKIGLGHDWKTVKKLIAKRVDAMDIPALVKETKRLIKKKYDFNSPALSALGYKDTRDFIDNQVTKPELLQRLTKLHTQYAKRQLTWFKKDPDIRWIQNTNQANKLISEFLAR